jgi:formamidopyrimidine-DNA glycosylase
MPELPEVQTVVDDLNKKIKGSLIVDFWTDWAKSIKNPLAFFKRKIKNKKIVVMKRRAKNILIYLDDGQVMLVHLKMTGHLLIKNQNAKIKDQNEFKDKNKKNTKRKKEMDYFSERVNQYVRHVWTLRKGKSEMRLEFSDLRKFGKIQLFKNEEELLKEKNFMALGVEPLEEIFDFKKFEELLDKKPKMSVRSFLLDQKIIAGIGNIYVSEIMFEAGVRPGRIVESLNNKERKDLFKFTKKILKKAVELRGTSDSDYRDTDGAPGGFQNVLKVYNREKEKCKRKGCSGVVKREKFNQRSAYFCEECQK